MAKKRQTTKKHREAYAKYLRSEKWKTIRHKIIARDESTCTSCGRKANDSYGINNFDVHHINYKHLFKEEENLESLRLVCRSCHDNITRAQRRGRKKATAKKGSTISIDMNVFFDNFNSLHKLEDKALMLLRMNKRHYFINEEFNKCFNAIIERLKKKDTSN